MNNSHIHIYRKDTGREVTDILSPVKLNLNTQESKIIPMCVKTDLGFVVLPDSDENGTGFKMVLIHTEPHWSIKTNSSVWYSYSPAVIDVPNGIDSQGFDFWLKCDCFSSESEGLHNFAYLQVYGIVSKV